MRLIHKNQKGFTLIELLIAVAIFAVVAVAANAVIVQIVQSNRTSSHMVALRQVQQAGYRVNLDALQAQNISVSNVSGRRGFPLTLNWTAWAGSVFHTVVYNLTDSPGGLCQLWRNETVGTNSTTTTVVGQYIYFNTTSPSSTQCSWNVTTNSTTKVLTLNITAMVGQETESRTYEIKPRCSV
jgi:prepilin-type N-terminal cleavage/methylation domain-containing protein